MSSVTDKGKMPNTWLYFQVKLFPNQATLANFVKEFPNTIPNSTFSHLNSHIPTTTS